MIKKKKVMLIFGTRPEAIKMAPLIHKLKSKPDLFDVTICVTAQHREMLDQVLKSFDIIPDIDLDIMKPGQDLFDVTANVLQGMKAVFKEENPDIALVHGDTTTTLAAAMACFYAGVPVGHVEAGLRTHDLNAPFPEEFNRQLVSRVASLHFAPTARSRQNLIAEKINSETISVTGNTVIDSLFWILNRIENDVSIYNDICNKLNDILPFNWKSEKYILITGHRRENFGDGFYEICSAIHALASIFPQINFLYPVHLNPNVLEPVKSILGNVSNIHLIEPLDYEPFAYLIKHCHAVLTDSGGIQEEAPSLGKPVLVMRDVTERPEAVEAGTVELVGANKDRIIAGVSRVIEDEIHYAKMCHAHNPYGDGRACERIAKVIENI